MKLTNISLRWAAALLCAASVFAVMPASYARRPHTKIHHGEDSRDKERSEKSKDSNKDKNEDGAKDTSPDKTDR